MLESGETRTVVCTELASQGGLLPLVVILGVMVGAAVASIVGVLLTTPIIAAGREVLSYLYNKVLEPSMAEGPPKEKRSLTDTIRERARHLRLPIKRGEHRPSAVPEQKQ